MELINTTRRKWYFSIPEQLTFEKDGISAGDGEISFDKKIFDSVDKCKQWADENLQNIPPNYKAFHDIEFKSFNVTPSEWEKIKSKMTVPENFTEEDVRVYHPFLAHNFVDRDGERFPKKILDLFNKTIIDKAVLIGHEWGPPGEGRFFDSKLERLTVDQAMLRLGNHPDKNVRTHLQKISDIDGGIYFLVPSFYMLKDNESFIRKLDAGIIKDMSIGFRCGDRVQYKDDFGSGATLWMEYSDNGSTEAMEGSFVWLGSQYSAGNRKNCNELKDKKENSVSASNGSDESKIDNTKDQQPGEQSRSAEATKPDLDMEKTKIKPEVKRMIIKMESIGFEKEFEFNEANFTPVLSEIETSVKALKDEIEKAKPDLDEFKKLKEELGEKKITELKSLADMGMKLKEDLISEVVKYGTLGGLVENAEEKIKAEKSLLESLTIDQIKYKLEQYRKVYDDKNSPKGQLPENTNDIEQPKQHVNKRAFREPVR